MENLVQQYPQCLFWVEILKKDNNYKNVRFKKLNVGYPKFVLFSNLFDEVNIEEFISNEFTRLPLFIGSQFGIYPKLENVFLKNNELKVIAVLSKSFLSGHVSGLKIYELLNYELKEIAFFKN